MEGKKNIRLTNEKKIDNKAFKLKVGTMNKLSPEAIYFEGRTFISPIVEKPSYDGEISEIKYHMKRDISHNLKNNVYFMDKYILDFKVALNGLSYNKKSFLSFQLIVRQKKENIMELKKLTTGASSFINDIVYNLVDDIKMHDFLITKTKK